MNKEKTHAKNKYIYAGCLLILLSLWNVSCGLGKETIVESKGTTVVAESSNMPQELPSPVSTSTSTSTPMPTSTPAHTLEPTPTPEPPTYTLGFAGDMNLDENWGTTQTLDIRGGNIASCIDPQLIEWMQGFDLFMLNNEFTYSDRGTPLEGKLYTFRAKPERVEIISEIGTDLVLLANNHVYDYGPEALEDTMEVLTEAGIPYVGAGKNIEEAMSPVYMTLGDMTIAYVAASKAEKLKMTPQATDTKAGILRCYDPELFLQVIEEADQNADLVIASIHWGTEYDNMANDAQRELAYQMIEAGADAIVGSHSHVLQGLEYYEGKPILYSLGNFWFNEKKLYSCLYELTVDEGSRSLSKVRFIPCTQYDIYTEYPESEEVRQEILDFEEGISFDISIDEEGFVYPIE